MALTGSDVVEVFKIYCKEYSKLFVPDSPRQDEVADSLANHYDSDTLLDAIKWYIEKEDGPMLVFDFALKSRDYVEKVKKEKASVDRFKQTVAETRKLIENNEL
jgi:hypothetical protein